MDIRHLYNCPLCGNTDFEQVRECVDNYATGERFGLWKCKSCGLLFTQDVPSEKEIGRYYISPDYISHTDTNRGLMNKIYHGVRRVMLSKKAALLKQTSGLSRGRLLDIGTGTGYFSAYMQDKGWRVKAIEKSPDARAFAQKHFGLDVMEPEALWQLSPESFDVVTLWHVLEHLEPFERVGRQLQTLLHERGILIIAVPNPTAYDACYYGDDWAAYDVPRHLWHFSPAVMSEWGKQYGFALMQQIAMPFDAFYVSMLSEKYRKHAFPFLRGMWVGTRALLASWVKKERSSSIIYVFRKK